MRIVRYHEYGDPASVVIVEDAPAVAPGVGEVVISLEAAPVHLADIKNITGQPWFRAPLPATPGYEGVGRVKAVGEGVKSFAPGDRVFLPTGFGAWREEFLAPAQGLWRAPERFAAEQLALLPINLQTAYLMLTEGDPVQAGDWVIQNAANSNVGYYVIRLARHLGLRTVNVVRREDAIDGVLTSGGDIALTDGDDLAERVADVVGGEEGGIRLALDAVGGAATRRLAACLGYEGRILNYGFLSGDVCEMSAQQMMFGQNNLSGFFTKSSLARMGDDAIAAMRGLLNSFIETDEPKAPIGGVYSFAQVHDALAHAALTGDARAGKIILKP